MSGQTKFPNGIDLGNNAVVNAAQFGGQVPMGVLRIAADVVDDQTVTIGSDVYRFAAVATDSTSNTANGTVNNTREVVQDFYMPAHGLIVGDILRIENEYMRVTGLRGADYLHLKRGVSGSTIAAHADAVDIFVESALGAGSIAVGLNATLTPVVASAALTADINDPTRGVEKVVAVNSDANTILVMGAASKGGTPIASALATATTETLGGAGNAWDAATLTGGRAPGIVVSAFRVPIAAEVTKGEMWFAFPFTPVIQDVRVRTTATGANIAWDGGASVVGTRVKLTNAGATDWATTDTVEVVVSDS